MGGVIVLGSLITDLVACAPRLPAPGETVLGDEFATFLGGKGFNQAVASARQGARVALIGQVGADDYGDAFFPTLEAEGIDSSHVARDPATGTGVSCVLVGEQSGQNMIVAMPRANLALSVARVEAALDALLAPVDSSPDALLAPVDSSPMSRNFPPPASGEGPGERWAGVWSVFLAQCETPVATVRAGLERARRDGLATVLNVAPIPREPIDDALLALVDVLIVNESEAAALAAVAVASAADARAAAERLLTRGPGSVVITLSAQGYLYAGRSASGVVEHRHEAAIPVRAVDATAAGDAFCGALAAGLAAGLSMRQALRRANAAGALATTRRGALPSLATAAEVDALLDGRR
jgi:ribokinase